MYHSWQQIFVGFSVGIATGLAYYYIVEVLFSRPIFGIGVSLRRAMLDSPILIALRVRDSWAVWDDAGVEAEYGFWREKWERRKRDQLVESTKASSRHLDTMLQALQLASQCEETNAAFSVGCVISLSSSGAQLSTGFSRQEPGNTHAEEVALNHLMSTSTTFSGPSVVELDLYTTMEPCSERLSKKPPCVQRILDFNKAGYSRGDGKKMKITRIFQGVQEPDDFVKCAGTHILQQEGVQVVTVLGPTKMQSAKTGEQVTLEPGWIEREALRLAKQGHTDQKTTLGSEARMWSEADWHDAAQPRASGQESKKWR